MWLPLRSRGVLALLQPRRKGPTLSECCTAAGPHCVCHRANLTELPLPVYQKRVKRHLMHLTRAEKKDREVRAGLRTLKAILGHGHTGKAERKDRNYAAQTKRRANKSEAKVLC
jgi:hypothetical protein